MLEFADMLLFIISRTMLAATPLLLATTGEIICERSGILNLGVEGMMAVGSIAAFVTAWATHSILLAVMAACAASTIFSMIHAVVTITFRANQTISGLALTMLGIGMTSVFGKPFIGKSLSGKINVPELEFVFFKYGNQKIDLTLDIFFIIAIIIAIAAWVFQYRSKAGIVLRAAGENPKAAAAQGVSVTAVRIASVCTGGFLAGLAGAQLAISYNTTWIDGIVFGRGWIAIALTIFSLWNPMRAIWGALLFGGTYVLQYILQPFNISVGLLGMLPYAATLIVLIVDGIRKDERRMHAPGALGRPFSKEER